MVDAVQVVSQIQAWGAELGFSQIGVASVDLSSAEPGILAWLAAGCHGQMDYMARHGLMRARPAELVPGTLSVVTARMDYLPANTPAHWPALERQRLQRPGEAVVSLYARGRDYHKVLRQRLQRLSERIEGLCGPLGGRVFTDSAPVLEVELASRSGVGWRGRHTLLLHRQAGSMFFLGEIFVGLALPPTPPVSAHCGQCQACQDACPTGAILGPGRLDARRCIAYLTIEHDGPIDRHWRAPIGNRIYGCDDCQLVCPWNKFAQRSALPDFDARPALTGATLHQLWQWDETAFLRHTEGSAIRRIGYRRWRRNLVIAMGNARAHAGSTADQAALGQALLTEYAQTDATDWMREHLQWALDRQPVAPLGAST